MQFQFIATQGILFQYLTLFVQEWDKLESTDTSGQKFSVIT